MDIIFQLATTLVACYVGCHQKVQKMSTVHHRFTCKMIIQLYLDLTESTPARVLSTVAMVHFQCSSPALATFDSAHIQSVSYVGSVLLTFIYPG